MIFTEKEINFLVKNGFKFTSSTTFFCYNNSITIDKIDTNEFEYYKDVRGSDLDRANNNKTELGLTWDELINLI